MLFWGRLLQIPCYFRYTGMLQNVTETQRLRSQATYTDFSCFASPFPLVVKRLERV